MSSIPQHLRMTHARVALELERALDLCALPDTASFRAEEGEIRNSEEVVARLGDYRVVRGPPAHASRQGGVPVYRDPGGRLYAATGRVWVRFAEGVLLSSREDALAEHGFKIDAAPDYAPHGGWVVSERGIGDALSRYRELEALPDCELVEPQLLRASVRREDALPGRR